MAYMMSAQQPQVVQLEAEQLQRQGKSTYPIALVSYHNSCNSPYIYFPFLETVVLL